MKISFFGPSIHPHKWPKLLESLKGGKEPYEVVFAGPIDESITKEHTDKYPELKYIHTENIKPAQCAEVARRACTGELVCWIEDDYEFSKNFVDNVPTQEMFGPILSIETNYPEQRFYSRNLNTPPIAHVGIMNRVYLQNIGGIDKRYIKGKWQADICMRIFSIGWSIIPVNTISVTVHHANQNGEYNNHWSGWNEDSEQLENSWVIGGYKRFPEALLVISKDKEPYWYCPISNQEVTLSRNDKFVPFEDKDLLTISQAPQGVWFSRWG